MKVLITGYSGFLGNFLCESLSKNFEIIKVNLRNIPEKNSSSFNIFLDQFLKADFIINCAASLKPKSKNDIFINQDFPCILAEYLKNKKKDMLFIHISTLNVIIEDRKDFYTITKKVAEEKLKNQNVIIIRLPLVLKKIKNVIQSTGNFKQIDNYLNFNFLPVYPMFFPGHIHNPVEIIKISNFIEKILFNKNNEYLIHNILGKEKKSLWDLFFEMAFNRKKKTLKINLILINKFMPSIIKNFFKKNSSFLQQLVIIDHSKFKEKKEYL
tara:strand:+ start:74 stop:880 length:807 start_codon:yes stop_codon:yes gene_type:complete